MKPAGLIGSLGLVLTAAALCHGQAAPYTAVVKDVEAVVHSGPSDKMYPTNRLRQGEVVQVVKARDDGWLEIKPPSGSFSWICTRFLRQIQGVYHEVVAHNDAPAEVRVGSSVVNEKPTVMGVRIERGSQVVGIGQPLPSDEGMWLPIEPPPSEVRFILAAAVQTTNVNAPPLAPAAAPPSATSSVSGGGAAPSPAPAPAPAPALAATGVSLGGSGPAPTTTVSNSPAPAATAPNPPADPNSPEGMWQQAEQLEKAGRKEEAVSLYEKLAKVCNNPKYHGMLVGAQNRIHWIKSGLSKAGALATSALVPARAQAAPTENRYQPQPSNFANPNPVIHVTAGQGQNQSYYGGATSPAQTLEPQSIGPGVIRTSGHRVGNQQAYAVEDYHNKQLLMYVTPQPGVNLDSYLGRKVNVYGPMVYSGELKANYMNVMSVQDVP